VCLHVSVSLLRDTTACRQAHSRVSVERYFRDWPNPVGFGTSSDIASSVASLPTGLAMTEFFPSREPLKVVRTKRWIHRHLFKF
jgi:hypothetical protein